MSSPEHHNPPDWIKEVTPEQIINGEIDPDREIENQIRKVENEIRDSLGLSKGVKGEDLDAEIDKRIAGIDHELNPTSAPKWIEHITPDQIIGEGRDLD